ncbi:hypothetical protein P3T32_000984 [Ralstonia sp. GP73]|jgi:hypothetical protein|uniref:Uncharacterized protein n=1 Tax=Ralstonia thomasii TaxID=3058596 RepID=A0AAD2BSX9_9RALS|nr:hypothetical protein [Ralstonia sp. GP73]CAJ0776320.1 hypothetical protein R77560_00140 [Ralstonia sp. LMG 18095]CAJ0808174.1 hypothetical protein LMG18095_04709 [Ralstonia sp. LMG 18095]CAJ0859066.1 hypothetical protein R6138_00605 [Ralstonia sp. LMG 18095]
MSFETVPPVSVQPQATLTRWRVFETELGQRHLVGHCVESSHGRVTSAVVSFDFRTRTGITSSGRRYALSGNSGYDDDAQYIWLLWTLYNAVKEFKDVTEEYDAPCNTIQ